MNLKLSWFLAFFSLVIVYIISNELDKVVTPSGYMFNTYMYILLGIVIVGCSWVCLDGMDGISINSRSIFSAFLVSLAALFGTLLSSSSMVRHVAWTVFMMSMGLISYVCYKYLEMEGMLFNVFASMVVLVGVLSWMAYKWPIDTFDSWFEPMMGMLLGLIVVQIVDYLVFWGGDMDGFVTRSRVYSLMSLLLFSGFLLYDTQKLRMNAVLVSKMCGGRTQGECANYPVASMSIFLDVMNLFASMSNLSGIR